ncbi:MAG: M20/M25/M40 family metallo-hydrolase [bacterium]|nr:M20/M25/M40 family metallo-hydrolase [bacterium]
MKRLSLLCLLFSVAVVAQAGELEDRLRAHVQYLADDLREGRGIGTKGLDDAASYIEAQFKAIGLQPAFGDSYFQEFEMGWGFTLGENNSLTYKDQKIDTQTGIMPLGFSAAGEANGKVMFVGYGITAPEYEYDDYTDVDVNGAIVLCMRKEPGEFDSTSKFEGLNSTLHSTLRTKASNAKQHGAVAMLIVDGPLYADTTQVEQLEPPASGEAYIDCGIPVLRVTRKALVQLFPEFELAKLQRSIDSNTQPRSLAVVEDSAKMVTDLSRQAVNVKNVGAVLPAGPDVLVIGAHYDHLGYGQSGSLDEQAHVIHNGADDNASGVAGMLETMRMLKEQPINSTVLAVAFTAEETGLGGSGHLVKNFPLDLTKVRLMLNLDMIGRVSEKNEFTVLSCKSAEELDDIVDRAKAGTGLTITCKGDGYGPSDHMNFYLAEKPVLFFFSGAHADYHKSTDDAHLINYEGAARITMLANNTLREVDAYTSPLTYVKTSEPPDQGGGSFRVYFGSIPDYSQADTLLGVLLSGTREGGPAATAGIKGGDLLVRMGKVTLNNIYDFVFALRTYAPGDTVDVEYVREGKHETTNVALKAPPEKH